MTPVSDQERYRRVEEEGSRRKRDLAGHRRVVAAREAAGRKEFAAARGADPVLPLFALECWEAVSKRIQESVPESIFRLWIEPLRAVAVLDDTLYLAAPEGIRAWAERRYSSLIATALADVDAGPSRVSFAAPWRSA